jgi:hypothetical protein
MCAMELNLLVVVDTEYHHLQVGRMGWAIALGRHDIQHICTALFSSITDGAPILQGSHVGPKLIIQSGNRTKIVDIPSITAYDAHTTLGMWQDQNGSLTHSSTMFNGAKGLHKYIGFVRPIAKSGESTSVFPTSW